MRDTQKKGKKAMAIAIYILLFTWIMLLVLLISIYMLRLQGYNNFMEWKNRNQNQEVLQPEVVTPVPTKEPVVPSVTEEPGPTVTTTPANSPIPTETTVPEPTITEEITPTPTDAAKLTPTVVPSSTPSPSPTEIPWAGPIFSGYPSVDEKIAKEAEHFFSEGEEYFYATYEVGIFFSVVFQKGEVLLPLVYDLTTGEQITGRDLIKESYFAVVKERLQSYVKEHFPEAAGSSFISYNEIYQAEDYDKFYLTEKELIFYFEKDVLAEGQPIFSYAVDLSEAKAFFYKDLEGNLMKPVIRELDPEAKMIALTFDDGPAYKYELDKKIMELCAQYDARVTFFFLGDRLRSSFKQVPGMLYENGHEIGSHTYSHTKDFAKVTAEELWTEVNKTNLLIAESTGYAPDYIRFPGGSEGKLTGDVPMVVVNWRLDTRDYMEKTKENGADIIYNRAIKSKYLRDGSIVLLHSIYETSYGAVEKFIPYLKEQGYELVTLSELFYYKYQGETLQTGVTYNDGFGVTE